MHHSGTPPDQGLCDKQSFSPHTPNPRGVISSDFKYLSINRGDDDHCDCILARRGGRLGARGGSRGAMKTAKSQVGRPRGWVRAPIVQTGTFCAMMRGCGVALPGSSPLDLRLCRPHHMYTCNVSVSSRSVSGQNAVPGIGSDSGNMSENVRFGGVAPTPLRRAAA